MASESESLLPGVSYQARKASRQPLRKRTIFLAPLLLVSTLAIWFGTSPLVGAFRYHSVQSSDAGQCPQVSPIVPARDPKLDELQALIYSEEFKTKAISHLSHAVQIDTESYDEQPPVGHDQRWDRFYAFAAFLEKTFPLIHERLRTEKVNTHGLLYTWQGSRPFSSTDEASMPLVLMAHQDVVPVNPSSVDQWTYPPYSGHYDGEWLWGRGAGDCKTLLLSTLETIELLLQADFKPARTIVILLGFDEESAGSQGAKPLFGVLHDRYGPNSVWAILDEGSEIQTQFGLRFASVSTAEKGHVNVNISINTQGGHSSVPPSHTSIGMLATLIQKLESNPDTPVLSTENPFYTQMQCLSQHAPDFPSSWRRLLREVPNKLNLQKLVDLFLKGEATDIRARARRYSMSTSQAVDIIAGGVKSNALPESAWVLVNYRVSIHSTVHQVEENIAKLLRPVAKQFGLEVQAFGESTPRPEGKSTGVLKLTSLGPLEAAPITPLKSDQWRLLSGTLRHAFGESLIVSPGIGVGNTDTRSSWDYGRNLTNNIFRFSPAEQKNIHTVNERVKASSHIDAIYFLVQFLRNTAL